MSSFLKQITISLSTAIIVLSICGSCPADTLRIPDSVKEIREKAFYGDDSLDQVVLPEGIEKIGEKAFASSGLKSINLPSSLTDIADDAIDPGVIITVERYTIAYEWAAENGFLNSRDVFWEHCMRFPTKDEIANHQATGRAPYIVCRPIFADSTGFSDYAVDFRADYLPQGTYLCTCNFDINTSCLLDKYAYVSRDYPGVGAYCGFQRGVDGKGYINMTVWNTYCFDQNGKRVNTIKATGIYPESGFYRAEDSAEGSFLQCYYSYDWKEGKDYRTVLQLYGSRLIFWIQDLSTQSWKRLAEFDLGYEGGYIKSPCVFLEDFSRTSPNHAEIRTMELSNFRVRDYQSRKWIGTKTAEFSENKNYNGSYNYGSRENVFWAITSNMEDRCTLPPQNMKYSVNACETQPPYN